MKDKLKDHIDKNRSDFELPMSDEEAMWGKIAGKLPAEKNRSSVTKWIIWKVAAMIIISAGLFYLILEHHQNNVAKLTANASHEFSETEEYYSALIDKKINFLKVNYPKQINKEFLQNLNALDNEYKALKDDLKDNISNTEVLDAMIRTYRMKLQILEEISKQLEEHHDYKTIIKKKSI